jgi:hypothetical protein
MKITNKTVWRTDHLKAILQVAAERELEPAKRKVLRVTVSYTRGAHSSGCAYVGGRHATVRIRHPFTTARGRVPLDAAGHDELLHRFASVAVHEFAHIRGMQHATMPANYKWHGRWREYVSWVQGMPLEVKAPKVVAKPTPSDKLAQVLVMKRIAETRLKRAQTLLKKWKAKERYYRKAAQAPGNI